MNLLEAIIAGKLGGGGGGGGGMEPFVVTFTYNSQTGFSSNKTLAEITAAKNAGKYVEGVYNGQFCPLVALDNSAAVFQMLVSNGDVDLDQLAVTANGCIGYSYGLAPRPNVVPVDATGPAITPEANNVYQCGELTSLAIDTPPATGAWSVVFTSGATPTTTTIASTILGLENFAAEANTMYEINVLDNRAVVGKWAVSA